LGLVTRCGLRSLRANEDKLRVVVHDYSGHPGQAQLSRGLAQRGHQVIHQHSPSYTSGKGSLSRATTDADTLEFEAVQGSGQFDRYAPGRRLLQEVSYGRRASKAILRHHPDVVLLSNVPLLAHALIAAALTARRVPMVFWHQDVYSSAIGAVAVTKLGKWFGQPIATVAKYVEGWIARRSASIVIISEAFRVVHAAWRVPPRAVHHIPNWGPLHEIRPLPRINEWSARHGLDTRPVVLYSGTLGLKHNPRFLVDAAIRLNLDDPMAVVIVISEGQGRDFLEREKADRGLSNLVLLDYQPYGELSEVLASCDVAVVLLEPEASSYSVPSKALTYLCAGCPILAVIPHSNPIADILRDSGAGVAVDSGRDFHAVETLLEMLHDPDWRASMKAEGTRYAEEHFDLDSIAAKFERVLEESLRPTLRT
jgi:colanic acid biosynthesis glycosyl transferase WcaI